MQNIKNLKIWLILFGFSFFIPLAMQAQNLVDLTTCYKNAEQNYPLINQYGLLERSEKYSLDQVASGNLPQIKLGGQWSYQSEVTEIPFSVPDTDIPTINKDQYRLYVDVSQPLTDLFTTQKTRKNLVKKEADVQTKTLDTEIYKLKDRINQLYFGILLMDRQIAQAQLMDEQIEAGININRVAVKNGTALRSSIRLLEAERLKVQKRLIDLRANRKAFVARLALFTSEPLNDDTKFIEPKEISIGLQINRPELDLWDAQKEVYETQKKLIDDQNLPRLSLFGQGGYGKPGLNMLSNQSDLYYVTGLRLSWDLSHLYIRRKDKKQLEIKQEMVQTEQETFLFNTDQSLQVHREEINKMGELILADYQILKKREEITKSAESQLKNGVLTTNDYLTYLNEEDEARQELLLHQIKRLKAMYDYKTTSGN